MKEGQYQQELKKKIRKRLPEAVILKNDPNWLQGFPDLTVLYKDRYAILEVKKDRSAEVQPNQSYYIEKVHDWAAFSSFIFPENEEEVLDGLQRSLEAGR